MEATLLYLVLDVAPSLLSNVTQHLAQHPLECIVLHGTAYLARRTDGCEAIVADVERSAEQVAALAHGIAIALLQASHVVLGPEHTRYDNTVQRDSLNIQTVQIVMTDEGQQVAGVGYKIRDAVSHAIVDAIERVCSYIYELLPPMLCLFPVPYRWHTPTLSSLDLHILYVGEALGIRGHTAHRVPLHPAFRGRSELRQLLLHDLLTTVIAGSLDLVTASHGYLVRHTCPDTILCPLTHRMHHTGKDESDQPKH